jgi:carboxyl-terminal processing protease
LTTEADADFWQMVRDAENEARLNPHRYTEFGEAALVWKMPAFDLGRDGVNEVIRKARKSKALLIDMRGNPGGAVDVLLQVTGRLFEKDVKMGDVKGRQAAKPMVAKGAHDDAFAGKVVALVDGASGSSAEVLARVLQLEKRGIVVGDRTRGAVMRSQRKRYSMGVDRMIFWSASITDADLIMSDGTSLEGRGVTPDELIVPAPEDLAAGRDPVLARAAQIAGLEITPEKAGAMFPIEWER